MSLLFFLFLFCVVPFSKTNAVTTHIDSAPQTITTDPFSVTVSIEGAGQATNYLRLELYKTNDTHYFGETFNGNEWYAEGDHTRYFPVTITESGWTGEITGRVGDLAGNVFDPAASYFLRVRRFTESGGYSAQEARDSSRPVTLEIQSATPTQNTVPTVHNSPTTVIPSRITFQNIFLSEAMVYPSADDHEWVELYNDNDFAVSLDNWFLDDIENGGSSPRAFSTTIAAKSYGVIDLSTSFFNNSGDSVRLLDSEKNVRDVFNYVDAQSQTSFGKAALSQQSACLQKPSKGIVNNSCITIASATPRPSTAITASISPALSSMTRISPLQKRIVPLVLPTFLAQGKTVSNSNEVFGIGSSGAVLGTTAVTNNSTLKTIYLLLTASIATTLLGMGTTTLRLRHKLAYSN